MTAPLWTVYTDEPEYFLALFDLRCPGAELRLYRELAGWRGFAHVEKVVDDRVVLVMRPGGAMELSR